MDKTLYIESTMISGRAVVRFEKIINSNSHEPIRIISRLLGSSEHNASLRHDTSCRLHNNVSLLQNLRVQKTSEDRTVKGKLFLEYYEASMTSSIQRVNSWYLSEFVLPFVTYVSVILIVQVIRFIIVSGSQNRHKSRISTALLSDIKTRQNLDHNPHTKTLKALSGGD